MDGVEKAKIVYQNRWSVECRPEPGGGETLVEDGADVSIEDIVGHLVRSGEWEHAQRVHERKPGRLARGRAVAIMDEAHEAPQYMRDGDRHRVVKQIQGLEAEAQAVASGAGPAPEASPTPGGGRGAEAPLAEGKPSEGSGGKAAASSEGGAA